ncbi:MAG TPA: DUF488 domain-containing protein [Chloroflexota bacterium]
MIDDRTGGATPAIYSIGHSNHALDTFLALLGQHAVDVVADVRSEPYSKYCPHFDKRALEAAVREAGRRYVYLGRELGGRPVGSEYYDAEGYVLYWRRAAAEEFLGGIKRLERGRAQHRIALLCSEEDPAGCHRHLLVGRVLERRGGALTHIRGDGRLQSAAALESPQLALFAEAEETAWRSIRSVSPREARESSSAP